MTTKNYKKESRTFATTFNSPEFGLCELVFDPSEPNTRFATIQSGTIKYLESLPIKSGTIYPLNASDDALRKGFIKLASEALPYESDYLLYEEIRHFIADYVDVPPTFLSVAAVYVMLSWLYDDFQVIPYLRVIGAFGSGKSRFLDVMGAISYKSISASGAASSASIFRLIDQYRGTLVIDEADFKNSEASSDITKILNNGFTVGYPVTRAEAKDKGGYDLKSYEVFGPKIVATRKRYDDEALESRCLTQYLIPKQNPKAPIHLPQKFYRKSLKIRNMLLSFRLKYYGHITVDDSVSNELRFPRTRQATLALTSVALLLNNDDVVGEILRFAKSLEKELVENQVVSVEAEILICLVKLLRDAKEKPIKLYMLDIASEYQRRFGTSDPALKDGPQYELISAKKVGGIITRLGLKKDRDGKGIYVKKSQRKIILLLAERYGITEKLILSE